MHLNFALISIFLLASAALADFQHEKQRPPFLNRVEKLVNGTTESDVLLAREYESIWAGAAFEKNEGTIRGPAATFVVPEISGEVGWGLHIIVGLDGYMCRSGSFWTGITMQIINTGVNVTSWGSTSNHTYYYHPNPSEFIISPGDEIRLGIIPFTSLEGFFSVVDYTTRKSWSGIFTLPSDNPLCQQEALFMLAAPPDGNPPLAKFDKVTFTSVNVTSGMDKATIFNIQKDNKTLTYVDVSQSLQFISITYNG